MQIYMIGFEQFQLLKQQRKQSIETSRLLGTALPAVGENVMVVNTTIPGEYLLCTVSAIMPISEHNDCEVVDHAIIFCNCYELAFEEIGDDPPHFQTQAGLLWSSLV